MLMSHTMILFFGQTKHALVASPAHVVSPWKVIWGERESNKQSEEKKLLNNSHAIADYFRNDVVNLSGAHGSIKNKLN